MRLLNFLLCMVTGFVAVMLSAIIGIVSIFKPLKAVPVIALLVIGFTFTSCHGDSYTYDRDGYDIITIDGCEYVAMTYGESGYLAHKGNCKNTIHCYNK